MTVETTSPPPEGGLRIILLIISFLIPIAGIIIGILYFMKSDEPNKTFGKHALIAAVASIVLSFACGICYFIFVFGLAATGELSAIGLLSSIV